MISIWFFVGLLLLAYGILILGTGILELSSPPNVVRGNWRVALPELVSAARVGRRLQRLDMRLSRELLALFATSAGEYLDRWFESAPIKAVYVAKRCLSLAALALLTNATGCEQIIVVRSAISVRD